MAPVAVLVPSLDGRCWCHSIPSGRCCAAVVLLLWQLLLLLWLWLLLWLLLLWLP
jgi:hypothetical protein